MEYLVSVFIWSLVGLIVTWSLVGTVAFVCYVHKASIQEIANLSEGEAGIIIFEHGPVIWILFFFVLVFVLLPQYISEVRRKRK
jgi:uncharacterized membrane protein